VQKKADGCLRGCLLVPIAAVVIGLCVFAIGKVEHALKTPRLVPSVVPYENRIEQMAQPPGPAFHD
jgi:hypothetical protein